MRIKEIKPLAVEEDIDVAEHRIERSRILYRWSQFVDNVAEPALIGTFLSYLLEYLSDKCEDPGLDLIEYELYVEIYAFFQQSHDFIRATEYASEEQRNILTNEYFESYLKIQVLLHKTLPKLFPIEI